MRLLVSILLVSFIVGGCGNQEKPDQLLAEDTYIDLMIELQLLKAYQQEQREDSTTIDSLKTIIFEKYEASESQFKQSHAYYQKNVDEHIKRIKQAIERLRKDKLAPGDTTAAPDSLQAK